MLNGKFNEQGQLVAGKWLAAWLTGVLVLAPAGVAVLVLVLFGSPDFGPIIAGFIGLVLLTGALSGIGLLTSALTSSQPVAAAASLFVGLLLWFANRGADAQRLLQPSDRATHGRGRNGQPLGRLCKTALLRYGEEGRKNAEVVSRHL